MKNGNNSTLVDALQNYLDNHPLILVDGKRNSVLDFLYQAYEDIHESDSEEVKRCFEEIDLLLAGVSLDLNNKIFATICKLIIESEQRVFNDGIKIGFALSRELHD